MMKKIAILYFLGALLLSGCVRDEFDTTRVEEGLAAHVGLKMMMPDMGGEHGEGSTRSTADTRAVDDDLENLLTGCRVRPAVNQLLLHIAGTDLPLLDYCTRQDIRVEAYSPIAHGEALKNPAITAMAEQYGVSVPQLCIRYVLQLGAVALPKTADPGHMRSNAAVDFAISPEDMETLRSMEHLTDYGDYNGFPVFSGKPFA